MNNLICPICDQTKKEKNKYCSFKCRNIVINRNKDYKKVALNVSLTLKAKAESLRVEKIVKCGRCDNEFSVKSNTKGIFNEVYYCSKKCSKARPHSEETKRKISDKIKKFIEIHGSVGGVSVGERHKCLNCENFILLSKKFCNQNCVNIYNRKDLSLFQIYKSYTRFKFGLGNYNDEFDFSLIDEFGWYKPANRGNNLTGISRDHILSVREGFARCINPLLLAHPANCKLMIHTQNISKNSKSDIDVKELLTKIKEFDLKHGKYYVNELPVYVNLENLKGNE